MALRVGLTGGIASGKSEVARRLAAYGAVVVDFDQLAREAVAPGSPGLAAVLAEFGGPVRAPDGTLDRARLGELVFADPAARRRLEAIVHPEVGRLAGRRAGQAGPHGVLVHDVPLLVEAGMAGAYDVVVVVATAPQTQLQRLVQARGLSPAAARDRVAAQAPLADKLAVADYVIHNDGRLGDLQPQVQRLWVALRDRAAAGPPGGPESAGRPA